MVELKVAVLQALLLLLKLIKEEHQDMNPWVWDNRDRCWGTQRDTQWPDLSKSMTVTQWLVVMAQILGLCTHPATLLPHPLREITCQGVGGIWGMLGEVVPTLLPELPVTSADRKLPHRDLVSLQLQQKQQGESKPGGAGRVQNKEKQIVCVSPKPHRSHRCSPSRENYSSVTTLLCDSRTRRRSWVCKIH